MKTLVAHRVLGHAIAVICAASLIAAPQPVAAQEIDGGEVLTWALIGGAIGAVIGLVTVLAQPKREERVIELSPTARTPRVGSTAPRDPELLVAAANLGGITLHWTARPRRDPRKVQLRFERYARQGMPASCAELELEIDGRTSRHLLAYQTSARDAIAREVFAVDLDVEAVRAMQAGRSVEFRFCGVTRTMTPRAADAAKKFLSSFSAMAGRATPSAAPALANVELTGAGAMLASPLFASWIAEYRKLQPTVRIAHEAAGSGIASIQERKVDFGTSVLAMTDEQLAKTRGELAHIPIAAGAVAIAYNLPGVAELKLDATVLAGIFLGEIVTWNDRAIAKLNAGVTLPARPIAVVYRADHDATTALLDAYLAKTDERWRAKLGTAAAVKFPVGTEVAGDQGMSQRIAAAPGSVGYIDFARAREAKLSLASLRNAGGELVKPSPAAIAAAAAALPSGSDLRGSILNAAGAGVYPISAFTYALVHERHRDPIKQRALAQFLGWVVRRGQSVAAERDCAALPARVVTEIETVLKALDPVTEPTLDHAALRRYFWASRAL
jgi:phosphate transport system substrate-binding protein